jgi:hypothetical protein
VSVRSSAIVLLSGEILSLVAGAFHPSSQDPNNHPAVFTEYAGSDYWTLIHLGQFIGMAVFIAGILILLSALERQAELPVWAHQLGRASALVALTLYGVLQAVDGVALKHAVDAWAQAPELEKLARFASAESMRWLEWGVRSYQSFMLGFTLLVLGALLVRSSGRLRFVGALAALSGVAYVVQGFILGSAGFSAANTVPQLLAYLLILVWSICLLFVRPTASPRR